MMNFARNPIKIIKAIFIKPERKIFALSVKMMELRHTLERASISNDSLTEIIYFFDIVSKWCDRGGVKDLIEVFDKVNYGQHDDVLKKLRTLQWHFLNVGRSQDGRNRTKYGETVTPEKVFLGGIFGLPIRNILFWAHKEDDTCKIVSIQAKELISFHSIPMVAVLKDLAVQYPFRCTRK